MTRLKTIGKIRQRASQHLSLLPLFLSLCLCQVSASVSAAEIYKSIDENGRVIYSDVKPNSKAKPLDLPSINTQPALKSTGNTAKKVNSGPNFNVNIVSPASGTTFHADQSSIPVRLSVSPNFGPGLKVQAIVDGAPYGSATRSTRISLNGLHRGEHSVSIELSNEEGDVISRSQAIVVYVKRPSVQNPNRNNS